MTQGLPETIRTGFEAVAQGRPELVDLRRRARARPPFSELDRLLWEAVQSYRAGPKPVWGPVLLELLAPAIATEVQKFEPIEPLISYEDISQQLVFEVLRAAAFMPMPARARHVDNRILKRAGFMVNRWLEREAGRQPGPDSPEEP